MSYRSDLDALAARAAALDADVARTTRERDETRRLLDEAMDRKRLPVLDNLKVASPCTVDWASMTGDERARHCGQCNKQVFNLTGLTRAEAEALLVEKAGKLCVRYFQRHDGTILLADCSVGVSRRRKRTLVAAGAAAMLASGVVGMFIRLKPEKVAAPEIKFSIAPEPTTTSVHFAVKPKTNHRHVDPPPTPPDEGKYIMGDIAAPVDEPAAK